MCISTTMQEITTRGSNSRLVYTSKTNKHRYVSVAMGPEIVLEQACGHFYSTRETREELHCLALSGDMHNKHAQDEQLAVGVE